jgi:hypothetical protein
LYGNKKHHREQKEENNLEQIFYDRRNKSIRTKEQITYYMETKNIIGNKKKKTTWNKKNCGTNFL